MAPRRPGGAVLIIGATGYIGGRLLARLERDGRYRVRCLTRRPERLARRAAPTTEILAGDVLVAASLTSAMAGVDTAFYLVHSMGHGAGFVQLDRAAARNVAATARAAGVKRIVYLGGLGSGGDLSSHLASRHEVGHILRTSGVPTIEFRASIVVGPGSASYEIVRAVAEHLPVTPAPRWIDTAAQPIAVEDVLDYLVAALDYPTPAIFEIGGEDRSSYADIMREYARQRGLRRPVLRSRLLTPRVSRVGLSVLAPEHRHVARALVDSLQHETVVTSDAARTALGVAPQRLEDAIARALAEEDREFAQTRWSAVLPPASAGSWHGMRFRRRVVRSRAIEVPHPPEDAFAVIGRLGGEAGWYGTDNFWRIRGALDVLRGGAGTRRGRRHPVELRPGDMVDSWRVDRHESNRVLRLVTEMKLPGRLWLQFEVDPNDRGGATIRLTTIFDPAGYVGIGYWVLSAAVHRLVFAQILNGIGGAVGAGGSERAPSRCERATSPCERATPAKTAVRTPPGASQLIRWPAR